MDRHPGHLHRSRSPGRPPTPVLVASLATILMLAGACASAGGGGGSASPGPAPESVWQSLLKPRPQPLPGAARVSVSNVVLLGRGSWSDSLPVSASLGLQELVSLDLLRRRDVQLVERRRFSRADMRKRRGEKRPPGAPPVGKSPGAQLVLTGTWAPTGADSAYLDLHLTDAETGRIVRSWRTTTPTNADLTSLARAATEGCLRALAEMHRRPRWNDPLGPPSLMATPYPGYHPSGVPERAVVAFLRGLAAEDRYEWDRARIAYQRALRLGGGSFYEPTVALARAARLRAGGTLGSS